MKSLKMKYQAPQVIKQGSAVKLTASTASGSCYDGAPTGDDHCRCAGTGSDCAKDPE